MKNQIKAEAAPAQGQHTPGPWRLLGNNSWAVFSMEKGREVCRANGADPWEIEANARLIAAAPDLLEALRGCLTRMEDYTASIETCDLLDDDEAAMKKARAAIARAERGQNS